MLRLNSTQRFLTSIRAPKGLLKYLLTDQVIYLCFFSKEGTPFLQVERTSHTVRRPISFNGITYNPKVQITDNGDKFRTDTRSLFAYCVSFPNLSRAPGGV